MSAQKPPPPLKRRASNKEGEDLAEPLPADLNLKTASIQLFQFNFSPPCAKVRALLHYYGVPFESVTTQPHQHRDDIDNSYGKVPKLVVDGRQINDSAVIVRTLAPLLTGEPLDAGIVELEKLNNVAGLIGALEKETASSYWGIAAAVRVALSGWGETYTGHGVKTVAPYMAGLAWPLPWAAFRLLGLPHGRGGPSGVHGRTFRKALGDAKFFHGDAPGPLDITMYGSLACFLALDSPPTRAVLDECDLAAWYERTERAYSAATSTPVMPP